MKRFHVSLVNGSGFYVEADFITRRSDVTQVRGVIFFWSKPHWYSRRRMVGSVDWQLVTGVWQVKTVSSAEIAKELGVKL